MNETIVDSSAPAVDQIDLLADEDSATEVDEIADPQVEASEEVIAEVVEVDSRPFLSTPLNDYTVTEGLLLMILLFLVVRWLGGVIKEGFYWLWS